MEIVTQDKLCILKPLSPILDERKTGRLFEEADSHSNYNIGIDLSFVKECTIDFMLNLDKHTNISIFNIPTDIFTLFNIMNVDKKINLYVNETDFKDNKRRLLNRKFFVV